MNRPEHLARFEEAFRSDNPAHALYHLAVVLRDEGISQVELYSLYMHFQVETSEDDPRHDAILDTMDVIYGGPYAKGFALYPTKLTESQIKEYQKSGPSPGVDSRNELEQIAPSAKCEQDQ